MLTLLTILLLLAAVSAYFYLYRHTNDDRLLAPARDNSEPSHLRPLFMPSDEDLRADELEAQKALKAIETAEKEAEDHRRVVDFHARLDRWKAKAAKEDIADLLNSVHDNGTLLADAAESICGEWDNGRLDLSESSLAQLIESHFWLVPAEKRTPGVSFRIQRLLSGLRSGGDNILQTHDSLR